MGLREIRPAKKFYFRNLVFCIALLSLTYFSFVGEEGAIEVLLLLFIIAALLNLTYWGRRLVYDDNSLTYVSYFYLRRKIQFKDIERWEIKIGIHRYMDRFKPTVRLEISTANGQRVVIPFKIFDPNEMEDLLNHLPE
mgnify:CR=1 FL=1